MRERDVMRRQQRDVHVIALSVRSHAEIGATLKRQKLALETFT